jgi:hypothetical protein
VRLILRVIGEGDAAVSKNCTEGSDGLVTIFCAFEDFGLEKSEKNLV